MAETNMRVVLLAGGVGGARMARGLAGVLPRNQLTVAVNIGDDERFYGLKVCPDLDTVLYTLSGRVDATQGWGVTDDATRALDTLATLGAPAWMKLGDADFGLHIYRSWRLGQGARLTEIMLEAADRFGVQARLLPASDAAVPTQIRTEDGWLSFQEWFVHRRASPEVLGLRYSGASTAAPTPEVLQSIAQADLIVIAPSNPLLSILPMLALPGMREALTASAAPKLAVSPLIGGQSVKGPLARMLGDLGLASGNGGIAQLYRGLIDGLVIDRSDAAEQRTLEQANLRVLVADTLIQDEEAACALARALLGWGENKAGSSQSRIAPVESDSACTSPACRSREDGNPVVPKQQCSLPLSSAGQLEHRVAHSLQTFNREAAT